jgi:beta-lactamase class A
MQESFTSTGELKKELGLMYKLKRDPIRKLLCVSAPLREIFFCCLMLSMNAVHAEDKLVDPVAKKVDARLEQIAEGVNGVMGFAIEDLKSEYRFAANDDREFAQGSAIKVPILMEVLKQADEGKLKLSDMHWVQKKRQVSGSGILSELGDHTTQMSVEDLCVVMIVLSDNTATNMLIDLVGMENVTKTMESLGCKHTKLRRRMLDTAASARGDENISSPGDAAEILRLLYEGKFVSRDVSKHALAILGKEKSGAVKSPLPAGVHVAFKVGEIPGVRTEWAIVELKNRPYIVVTMGAFGLGDEFEDVTKEISKMAYDFFSRIAKASKYGAYMDPAGWQAR